MLTKSQSTAGPTSKERFLKEGTDESRPTRRIVTTKKPQESSYVAPTGSSETPQDTLIVASKLKNYIKAKSGMNTSANVMDRLSDLVRNLCDDAIMTARKEERKTVEVNLPGIHFRLSEVRIDGAGKFQAGSDVIENVETRLEIKVTVTCFLSV